MLKKKLFKILETWWITIDKTLLSMYLFLLFLGSIFIFTAGMSVAERINVGEYYFFKHQIFFSILAMFLVFFASLFEEEYFKKFIKILFIIAFVMLLLVPIFGFQTKGARRWIYIFNFSIQPTEILKPLLIVLNAYLLTKFNETKNIRFLLTSVFVYLICSFLIYKQPDIGTLILITIVFFTQIFLLDCMKLKSSLYIGIFMLTLAAVSYFTLPHVHDRVNSFVDSLRNPNNINYQVKMSIASYQHSNLLGQGFLEGEIKNYIPDAHTDFIFPAITEEFGFIIAFLLVSLYFYIALRIIIKANLTNDHFKFLSLYGLALLFLLQTVINLSVSLNLVPTKGITLPLLSYGGSSLIGISLTFGIILILTRKTFDTEMDAENSLDLSYFNDKKK